MEIALKTIHLEIYLIHIAFHAMNIGSLPAWERELKYVRDTAQQQGSWSLPAWERELKSVHHPGRGCAGASLPAWERELKFREPWAAGARQRVAPRVGA